MSATQSKPMFGRIFAPRPDWLAKAPAEPIIDAGLPIIDTHHHLWHRQEATGAAGDFMGSARASLFAR